MNWNKIGATYEHKLKIRTSPSALVLFSTSKVLQKHNRIASNSNDKEKEKEKQKKERREENISN